MTVKEYFVPQSLEEALGLLNEHGPGLLVMAGGTLAMPLINDGVSMPELVMSLKDAGLGGIQANGGVTLGATATLTQVLADSPIEMLMQAANSIGGWAIRNMATVGGNLFAPPPSGDLGAALLALGAEVTLAGKKGERTVPLSDFYTGFMTTAVEAGELVTAVKVPAVTGETTFVKYGRKHDNTPAIVTVAAQLALAGDTVKEATIALNGVGPHPMRAVEAEMALTGNKLDEGPISAAADAAAEACDPFTDAIASDWYRRKMTKVYVFRALAQIAGLEE